MSRSWTIVAGAALLAMAWVADRLLVEATIRYGTHAGTEGTQELLLLADRLPKLVLLAAMGGLLGLIVRRGIDQASSFVLAVFGGILAAVPILAFSLGVEPLLPVARELVFPAQFFSWTAVALLVIGPIGLLGVSAVSPRSEPIPAWGRVVLAIALLVAVLPLDALVQDAYLEAAASGDAITAAIGWDIVARTLVLGALALALSSALRGPRDRVAGAAILVSALIPFIGLALIALVEPPTGSIGAEGGIPVAGYAMRWLSGGIALIGALELIAGASATTESPQARPVRIGQAPRT